MVSLKKIIVHLIIVSSAMGMWQYSFGLTYRAHDIFGVLFILLFAFSLLAGIGTPISLNNNIKTFILLCIGSFIVKILSYIGLIYHYLVAAYAEPFIQYLKGVLHEFLIMTLFICISVFICRLGQTDRHKIAWTFVVVAMLSCLYQYVSLFLILNYQIDLDDIIWPAISYNINPETAILGDTAMGDDSLSIYRAGGLAVNSNSFAALLICIIPFLLLCAVTYGKKLYLVCCLIAMTSLILTMSRSGLLGIIASFVIAVALTYRIILKRFKLVTALLISMILILIELFWGHLHLFFWRGSSTMLDSPVRLDLNAFSFETFLRYPLGIGYNSASTIIFKAGTAALDAGRDLHNAWLNILVEQGVTGLIFAIAFSCFVIRVTAIRDDIFSKGLCCSYIGLCVQGFFNNDLVTFPIQLFIVSFFCVGMLEGRTISANRERDVYPGSHN